MRWLQNISFSSSSSPPTSFSSPSKTDDCSAAAAIDLRKGNPCEDQHRRRDRRDGVGGPTLTRARKLRHLADYDVAISSSLKADDPYASDSAAFSRSASSDDGASTSRCSPILAVPLPLPLPDGKPDSADGEGQLLSTKEIGNGRGVEGRQLEGVRDIGKERDRKDGAGEPNSPISR